MQSLDKASLSTLVTVRFIWVPVTTDKQVTTVEYTYCWIECSVFGLREVMKGEQFARRIRERISSRKISQPHELIN
jgi:hypothetical protein